MPVLKNISTLYTCIDQGGQGDIHPIQDAAVCWRESVIDWVGPVSQLPDEYRGDVAHDAKGKVVIPGLVDCHTHLVFGGWRPDEFEMRVEGQSYLEIAREGGGILSTVNETRVVSEDALFEKASALLIQIAQLGVTTVECKSGYGLTTEDELKILRVIRRLAEESAVTIIPTFLGAHTIPREFQSDREDYIQLIMDEMIPCVADEKLAVFCDVFVDDTAFSVEEAQRILECGKEYGLRPKLHADQLSSCGGAELAAEVGAISADHLEQVSDQDIRSMADAGVTGVALPFASLYTQQPFLDCRKLVSNGVRVAVATDFNPGSAPSYDLPLAMMLACNLNRLTPTEVLKAATIYAAGAIGIDHLTGSIESGKYADFVVMDTPSVNFWMYHFTSTPKHQVYLKGRKLALKQTKL